MHQHLREEQSSPASATRTFIYIKCYFLYIYKQHAHIDLILSKSCIRKPVFWMHYHGKSDLFLIGKEHGVQRRTVTAANSPASLRPPFPATLPPYETQRTPRRPFLALPKRQQHPEIPSETQVTPAKLQFAASRASPISQKRPTGAASTQERQNTAPT